MSYQAIARKWRSQKFSDLVGQDHVTQTLFNALKNHRIHHALLFTGPRGTGKTSSARILAKSLRCPNAVDFVPCNQCDSCREVSLGRSLDVQELDAASNNSVDDIRKLLEGVMSAPSSGKFKVYIIDEVHMLSTSAFNALLKTLEEPPGHVIFIMATTEVQKIPQTILSRCQRFDFRRISTRLIADRLQLICQQDGIAADEDALWLIARQGDGSMRDAQSLLDQVVTFSDSQISKEKTAQILGLTDRLLLSETLSALVHRDTPTVLTLLARLTQSGVDPKLFAQDLLENIRHLLVVRISAAQMTEILDLPDSELKFLAELSANLSEEDIHLLFDMALKGTQDIVRAQDPYLVLEMVLLRISAAPRILQLNQYLQNSASAGAPKMMATSPAAAAPVKPALPNSAPAVLSNSAPAVRAAARPLNSTKPSIQVNIPTAATPKAASPSTVSAPASTKAATPAPAPKAAPAMVSGNTTEEKWLNFIDLVRTDDAVFAAKIENLNFIELKEKHIHVGIPAKMNFLKELFAQKEAQQKLQNYVRQFWGAGFEISSQVTADKAENTSAREIIAKKQQSGEKELAEKIAQHPVVQAAQKAFNGEIKSITPLRPGK